MAATTLQEGLTPLLLAIHRRNKDLATQIIDNGADMNTPSKDVSIYLIMLQSLLKTFLLILTGRYSFDYGH